MSFPGIPHKIRMINDHSNDHLLYFKNILLFYKLKMSHDGINARSAFYNLQHLKDY